MRVDKEKGYWVSEVFLALAAITMQFSVPGCANGPSVFSASETDDGFSRYAPGFWEEGRTYGSWSSNFCGLGQCGIEIDTTEGSITKVQFQKPALPDLRDTTHACLVTTRYMAGDFDLSVRVKTVRQYRLPEPHSWEVAWVIWHFVDNSHFYYCIVKANSWELGKADPAYPGGQRFLRTGTVPELQIGKFNEVRIHQRDSTLSVSLGGIPIESVTDREKPLLLGKFGLYTEDAYVRFKDFHVAY